MRYALALMAFVFAPPLQAQVLRQNGGGSSVSASSAAATYVNKAGDSMTGTLQIGSGALKSTMSATGAANFAGSTLTVAITGFVNAPSQPRAIVSRNATLTFPANADVLIHWTTGEKVTQGMWAVTPDSSTITIPAGMGGSYDVHCQVTFQAATPAAADYTWVQINKNGSAVTRGIWQFSAAGQGTTIHAVELGLELAAADVLTCIVRTNTTGGGVVDNSYLPRFSVVKR